MIDIKFCIENPWWNRFESIICWNGKIGLPNKYWELQILKSDDIIAFDLRISHRYDHAGIDLWLGLFGFAINFKVYDNRHWANDSWEMNIEEIK